MRCGKWTSEDGPMAIFHKSTVTFSHSSIKMQVAPFHLHCLGSSCQLFIGLLAFILHPFIQYLVNKPIWAAGMSADNVRG